MSLPRLIGVLLALILAGPATGLTAERREPLLPGAQPVQPRLGAALPAGHTAYANDSLAEIFVRLTHDLEWGGRRPHLVRYEAPVSVGVSGSGAERYAGFLDAYLAGLRTHSGIDIARGTAPHNLMIRFVPGPAFRRLIPRHFCVVAPGSLDWETFRRRPGRLGSRAFETARRIDAMTVFIPDTAEPWLVRTCLIEEIAQALGPANDLYGLGPSIFNDDAAHVWPTALDYLMIRVLYAREMRTGLGRAETRRRALLALDRLNPQGRDAPPLSDVRPVEMGDWARRIRDAFDPSASPARRERAVREAVRIAAGRAPLGVYHCRSLMALGRTLRAEPRAALDAYAEARRVCAAAHGAADIRLAQIRLSRALLLYRLGRASAAWGESEGLEAIFAAHAQEERLATLYALQAEALGAIQQVAYSARARRRAGAWGAFALGRDHADVRRLNGN